MKISLNWLNDYVDIKNENKKELAEKITRAGVNVEHIISNDINGLTTGYVKECINHPNSDHLHICQVELKDRVTQIVCGASNIRAGIKVIVALEGCLLPNGLLIKKSVIRGEESNGMICSLEEIGLEKNSEGIYILKDDAVIGENPLSYLGSNDTIYELDLNPNRNDCLSHIGFAYLVGSVLNKEVTLKETKTSPINDDINNYVKLNVSTDKVNMYLSKMVKNIKIMESPDFIKERLISAGLRPINNVVDISNYIMLEYGQPLHFFDYDRLGHNINVRMANNDQKTVTLDGNEVSLTNDDIVISNDKEIVAIAGVMGSKNSMVDNQTKTIVIESAIFNPYNVRYTSIRLGLRSESSLRFEKGLNYEYTKEAIERACYLLNKYADGEVLTGTLEYDHIEKKPKVVEVSLTKINQVLGLNLNINDVNDVLMRLKFNYELNGEKYTITIPERRMDVSIKEDIIEEIGCLYGYDNIKSKMPALPIKKGVYNSKSYYEKLVNLRMRTLGFDEVRTYTLIDQKMSELFNNKETISLLKPLSSDKKNIRTSIIPSLLKVLDYNLAHHQENANIYEISNVYYLENSEYIEESKLAFLSIGNVMGSSWSNNKIKADFYYQKGMVENLLNYLGFTNRYQFSDQNIIKEMHPYSSANILIDNEVVGFFGKINPIINQKDVYVGEINLTKLMSKKTEQVKYKEPTKYPSITKDMSFVMNDDIKASDMIKAMKQVGGNTLINIKVFDVYKKENQTSIAFSLEFNDKNKTLTEEEVMLIFNNIIKEIENKYKVTLRNK